jgi:hypothetical protein
MFSTWVDMGSKFKRSLDRDVGFVSQLDVGDDVSQNGG